MKMLSRKPMTIDRATCLEPCATEGSDLVGRDPRQMGRIGLEAAGFEPSSPMETIRAKSPDCCVGSAREVRYCVWMACPSWPFRMGSNRFRAPVSDARRAALRANALKGRAALAKSPLAGYRELSQLIAERRASAKGLAQAGRNAPENSKALPNRISEEAGIA